MSKLQEIYDGWKNLLIPDEKLKPHIEKVSKARMNICNTCEWSSKNKKTAVTKVRPDEHCTKCGCTLATKTRSLTSSCPIEKWKAVVK